MRTSLALLVVMLTMTNVNADTLTFGVVPQQSASKLAKLWVPICKRLSSRIGHKVVFKTAPSIPEFEKRVAAGEYDIAYMNPYHFTVFSKNPGYTALAKAKDKQIRGIVVVAKDSDYTEIEDFEGATLAFPAPAAFAATILPRAEFQRRGINISPRYVSSHDSVYRSIAKGLYPAGGGVIRTFKNVDAAVRDKLKVLWTTNPYTPHAIAAHPRLDINLKKKLRSTFVNFDADDEGLKLLNSLKLKGFVNAKDDDWNDVRGLNIETQSQSLSDNN